MTREEAIAYWNNHFETGNTEQNDAVYNYLHEEQIEKAAEAKSLQAMYKG